MATSTSGSNEDSGCTRDYTSKFKATKRFRSREDLENWAKKVGRSDGFTIVVLRSDSGKGEKKPGVTLGCERSGKSDSRNAPQKKMKDEDGSRCTGSKKCGCPFKLRGEKLKASDEWELMIVKGMHNHEAGHPGKGHSFQGTLFQEEKQFNEDSLNEGKRPRDIEKLLKNWDVHNKSTCRTLYYQNQVLKSKKNVERVSSALMSQEEEYRFIVKQRNSPKNGRVDFVLTHPTSLKLLLAFPTVLIIKTGRLFRNYIEFQIWGVTSTKKDFFVAVASLWSKRENSYGYQWALSSLQGVMDDNGIARPDSVIFRPPKSASKLDPTKLKKAISYAFSPAKLLLCRDSIRCTVASYVTYMTDPERADAFIAKWNLLIDSPTEAEYEQQLRQLHTEFCITFPEAVKYVRDTVLESYKEMLVAAWTDKVMHFGNTELISLNSFGSNRILIFFFLLAYDPRLPSITDGIWKSMLSEIEEEHAYVKASFMKSLEYRDKCSELKELYGFVSIEALQMIYDEIQETAHDHSNDCSCTIKSSHGLPCRHEIAKYRRQDRPIPLEIINSHWRKLDLEPLRKTGEPNVEERMKRPRLSEEMNTDTHSLSGLSLPEIGESERNSLNVGPSIVPSNQERQPEDETTKQLKDVCPLLRPYILGVKDVQRDGHCGFRAIAAFMGYSEEVGWKKVREDLRNELMMNAASYAQLFGSCQRFNELIDALTYFESKCLQKEHWMTMPDMGHIIASCYNVVLMHLSSVQCFTFFPLRTAPASISISSTREIVLGFDEEHFVQVDLKEGHPMPPPTPAPTRKNPHAASNWWEGFHQQRSTEWATLYHSRIEHFKSLQPAVVSQKNPIVLDIDSLPSADKMDDYFHS